MKNKKYTVINGEVKEISFVEERERMVELIYIPPITVLENIYSYKQGNLNVEIALEDELVFSEISTANLYKKILEQENKLNKEIKKPWYKLWDMNINY